jgi:ABC-type transport system involved in cytochrome bd biosynthesis fused ATPase/permease subunit
MRIPESICDHRSADEFGAHRPMITCPTYTQGMTPLAVDVSALVKRYGTIIAADGLSFTAACGEVTALLGPNGAGKTTTVEICEGYRRADGGTVRVLGRDPRDQALRARSPAACPPAHAPGSTSG